MKLNTLKPQQINDKKRRRVGRGIGSGLGKTCGRGHKGQHSRSGGYHKIGFEGGQMPLIRRLPKYGFKSHLKKLRDEITLEKLEKYAGQKVTPQFLKERNEVSKHAIIIKVIAKGTLSKAIEIEGLKPTKGALKIIKEAGGIIFNG